MADSLFVSGFKTGFGSAFLQFGFERLANFGTFSWKEMGIIWGVEDELRKLQRTFLKIQDLVVHVESSPLKLSSGSKAWQIWFEDLRKLAYDADALLDHVALHLSKFNQHSGYAYPEKELRRMILSSFQLDLPHEITEMQKKLEELAQEMKSLVKMEKVKMDIHKYKINEKSYNSSSLVDGGVIVGREKDKQNVVNFLVDKNDFSVISLVGIGGIGKSTLARLIFNDEDVGNDFKLKIWVSAFEFDVVRITKLIIESATQRSCSLSDLDSLQLKLRQILISKKRLLLVLVDYWNENQDDWELLCRPIRSAFKGSKVIVTTRSSKVSRIVGSIEAYSLQSLSHKDCWLLMKQRAFFKREEKEILEPLGIEIAKKCQGLPLAARTLGSVLQNCKNSTEDEWRSILKSELWDLPGDGNNSVFASLMLSYLHLPAHLQKCFAYCSVFPQNHEFQVEELVHLWMAEGFIQNGNQERSTEEIGNYYFQDLLCRLFFVQGTNSLHETIYKMHPLIHDLACLVSKDACLQLKLDMLHCYPLFGNACHLSLHHDNLQPLELKASHKNERLRTFLVMCKQGASGGHVDQELFHKLKFVRVLDLSNIGLLEVPESIEHLIYLRYINLSGNRIKSLPRSICKLLALQTLKLVRCPGISLLPSELGNLSNLRHLIFDKLSSMPPEFGKLTNLQTLSTFVVGRREGHGIEELEKMDFLRGSLSIKNVQHVSSEGNASKAKLHMKPSLRKLELLWAELYNTQDIMNQQDLVLINLRPHENLNELVIENFSGTKCPDWLSNSQRKFTRIHLKNLDNCKTLPAFGQLPHLKHLQIEEMKGVDRVDDGFYGVGNGVKFPALEVLEVYQMVELVEWREDSNGCILHALSHDFQN